MFIYLIFIFIFELLNAIIKNKIPNFLIYCIHQHTEFRPKPLQLFTKQVSFINKVDNYSLIIYIL